MGPSQAYYNSIIEICDVDQNRIGTGTVINELQVLTCAHVVALAYGLDPNATHKEIRQDRLLGIRRPYVDGADTMPRPARCVKFYGRTTQEPQTDLAIVELTEGKFVVAGSAAEIVAFAEVSETGPDDLFIIGYPDNAAETRTGAAQAEYLLGGKQPNGWRNLEAKRGFGQEIRHGFSGAPAWSNTAGRVVGIITEADDARRSAVLIPTAHVRWVANLRFTSEPGADRSRVASEAPTAALGQVGFIRLALESLAPRLHYFLTKKCNLMPTPAEQPFFEKYLREFAAELKARIMEKTYIPPPSADPSPLPPQFSRHPAPFQQYIKEITGLSQGGDAASAQISALSKQSRRIRNLVRLLVRSKEPLILLGDPGSGKSLTLQQCSMLLAEANARRILPIITLFIPAGRWQPMTKPDVSSVEDLVRLSCPSNIRPYLSALEDKERLVVVFDGLDEMSRERYTEHVEALSKYAEARRGQTRTLFSCRIADFSPDFRHRRLVLLPFESRQVRDYIQRQFGGILIQVDSQLLKPKALAKRICDDDMPVQGRNPFVLSLLCIYVREKRSLPAKRVDLLEFYYNYAIERKEDEISVFNLSGDLRNRLFDLWGQIAFEITLRDKGTDIAVPEVRRILGQHAAVAIGLGRLCGVLHQTVAGDPPLVRFEHHRAQEYFAALHLFHERPNFDWLGKLDVPRWQETLINVTQMGGGTDALKVLADSLNDLSVETMTKGTRADSLFAEALAAERVELAARIIRDHPTSDERTRLQDLVRGAVARLLDRGNAVSKVKMLRVSQQSPYLATPESIQNAIKHKASWVRDQAYVVAARLADRLSASALPEEFALNFGTGGLLRRARDYFLLGQRLKDRFIPAIALAGVVLLGLEALAFAMAGPLLLELGKQSLDLPFDTIPLSDAVRDAISRVIFYRPFEIAVWVISFGLWAWNCSHKANGWFYSQMIGSSTVIVPVLIVIVWNGEYPLELVLASLILSPYFALLALIVAIIVISVFAGLFGVLLASWTKSFTYVLSTLRMTWKEAKLDELVEIVLFFLGAAAVFGVGGLVFAGYVAVGSPKIWYDIPYTSAMGSWLLTSALVLLLPVALSWLAYLASRYLTNVSNYKDLIWKIALIATAVMGTAVGAALLVEVLLRIETSVSWIDAKWRQESAVILTFTLATASFGAFAWISLVTSRRAYGWVRPRLAQFAGGQVNPLVWAEEIRRSSAANQAILLARAAPDQLGIDAKQLLDVLARLEPAILADPALTAYWSKCAQLLELVRQQRAG